MSVNKRIKQIIDNEKLSISGFEKKCGLSNNSIQTSIKRNANLKDTTLNSILKAFPHYNPTWLLTGKGDMIIRALKVTPAKESKISRKVLPSENKDVELLADETLEGENALLKEKVGTLEKQLEKMLVESENRKSKREKTMKWYFAAVFLSLLGGAIYQVYLRPYSNDTLFNAYYKPFNPEHDNSDRFTQAIFNYGKGNFKKAIELFDQADSLNYAETFYLALSYCGIKDYPKAIKLFLGIKVAGSGYMNETSWYLGLCYLKVGETGKAIKEFEPVAKGNSPYKEKACKVLKEIKDN